MDEKLRGTLDAVAIPLTIAQPVFDGAALTDLTLSWANSQFLSFGNFSEFIGRPVSEIAPGLIAAGWLEQILEARGSGKLVSRLRVPHTNETIEVPEYQLVAGWDGDEVLISIVPLDPEADADNRAVLSALNASRDGFSIWRAIRNPDDSIHTFVLEYINDAGAEAAQRPARELHGLTIEEVISGGNSRDFTTVFQSALESQEIQVHIVHVVEGSGWDGAFENRVIPMDRDRVASGFRDISEERREHNRLTWLAEHDHLTGAPNRTLLERLLRETLANCRERQQAAVFVFIDIDDFKSVNDRFGHQAGDKLLVHFVERLQHTVGARGEVARIAGDEFALVLPAVASRDELSELLREVLQSMQRPFDYLSSDMYITVSAGGILTAGQEDAFEVMRIADRLMYRVKHKGKNDFELVDTAKH